MSRRVFGRDVKVGDELLFFGHGYIVRAIDPYTGQLDDIDTTGWRIARAADGWAMTLIPWLPYEVADSETAGAA